MCRRMSPLFSDREQQDSHEFLRSILLYIQEATRAINHQRATYHDITTSTSDVASAADVLSPHPKDGSLSESAGSSLGSQLHSAFQSPEADNVKGGSPSGAASMTVKVSTMTPEHDCLLNSSRSGSSQNSALPKSKPHAAAESTSSSSSGFNKTPTTGKITGYFVRAPPAPKTASEITVTTSKVADFVDTLCEGKSERTTRCLECECVTRCTETFQDMEVVAQKAKVCDSDGE